MAHAKKDNFLDSVKRTLHDAMQPEASELNLVRCGLEETMKEGFENILKVKKITERFQA